MIVLLDTSLSEKPSFIAELSTQLKDLGVAYRVKNMDPAGSVRWKRKLTDRTVDDNAQVLFNAHCMYINVQLYSWVLSTPFKMHLH